MYPYSDQNKQKNKNNLWYDNLLLIDTYRSEKWEVYSRRISRNAWATAAIVHFLFASEAFRLLSDSHHSLCFVHTHILIRGKITKLEKINFALSDLGLLISG